MKTTYISIVYDYLVTNDILEQFLYNREHFPNQTNTSTCSTELINYAIIWADTPEEHEFWKKHNDTLHTKLRNVNCVITIAELIEQLNTLMQPQPYEFW